ncbi:endopolygalacturonase [Diplocarpon rosae]|nr:endopolygalacturonase [Diplocarpon rosae]
MVQLLNTIELVLGFASFISASPTPGNKKTTEPKTGARSAVPRSNSAGGSSGSAPSSCTFTTAAAALAGKAACKNIILNGITVEAGVTLDLTGLADGTSVVFQGTTTWEYEEWSGPLFAVSGSNIAVSGAAGHVLDGNGAKWWDGQGGNGGKTKPKFFYAHSLRGASTIKGLHIQNYPLQCISVSSADGLTISDVTIDNSAAAELGHNTDAFNVGSSSNVVISGVNVTNQDDCLAINSGTGITFTGGTCTGGHGLSIGSVGGRTDNTVSNVTITSSTIIDSQNGLGIKTLSGATGSVKGVTFKDIKLSGITDFGIVIRQDYRNGNPTGTPTAGVPITDLTVSGVTGTLESTAENVLILCAACSDWTWTGIAITGGTKSTSCVGVPTGSSC